VRYCAEGYSELAPSIQEGFEGPPHPEHPTRSAVNMIAVCLALNGKAGFNASPVG
jgi:hypothetical protein